VLWVADRENHRVVRYGMAVDAPNGGAADGVLGQGDLRTNEANRGGEVAANTLAYPEGVAIGDDGTLWIADSYNHRVVRAGPVADDATLRGLEVSSGTLSPTFDPETTSYRVAVGHTVAALRVTPQVNNLRATVTVNGGSAAAPVALSVGANAILVEVTAQDGVTTRSYTVTVVRAASSDASLRGLQLSAGTLTPSIAPETTSYTATVAYEVEELLVTPTPNHGGATVTVNGGSAATPVALSVGPNVITVVVTAQDGVTTQSYTVTVERQAAQYTLEAILPSQGSTMGGTLVSLVGLGVDEATGVTFGGVAVVTQTVVSPERLDLVVPPGVAGMVTVTVTVANRTLSLVNGYTYVAPVVATIDPTIETVIESTGAALVIPAGAVSGTTVLTYTTGSGTPPPGIDLSLTSFSLDAVSNGEQVDQFNAPIAVTLEVGGVEGAGWVRRAQQSQGGERRQELGFYRYDVSQEKWIAEGSSYDRTTGMLTAAVGKPGTYAVLMMERYHLLLPLVAVTKPSSVPPFVSHTLPRVVRL
jgi:hypothetical protein